MLKLIVEILREETETPAKKVMLIFSDVLGALKKQKFQKISK